MMRNVPQPSPMRCRRTRGQLWNQIELVEVYLVPRDRRVLLETWAFVPGRIHRPGCTRPSACRARHLPQSSARFHRPHLERPHRRGAPRHFGPALRRLLLSRAARPSPPARRWRGSRRPCGTLSRSSGSSRRSQPVRYFARAHNRAMPASSMGCALPSIRSTSCPAGVSACSRNIHRCGMKLRVTPLSGLYSRIRISFSVYGRRAWGWAGKLLFSVEDCAPADWSILTTFQNRQFGRSSGCARFW